MRRWKKDPMTFDGYNSVMQSLISTLCLGSLKSTQMLSRHLCLNALSRQMLCLLCLLRLLHNDNNLRTKVAAYPSQHLLKKWNIRSLLHASMALKKKETESKDIEINLETELSHGDPPLPICLKFLEVQYKVILQGKPTRILRSSWTEPIFFEKDILHGVSGSIAPGEMLAMMGPSGSGKTTLINLLAGRIQQNVSGNITYNDRPYSKALKRRIGFLTQDDVLFPHLTSRETLTYTALLRLPRTLSKHQREQQAQEDVMKIGNQLPFFLLPYMLQWDLDKDENYNLTENTDEVLNRILKHAWVKLSPIQHECNGQDCHVIDGVSWRPASHFLEFVYENIISPSDIKNKDTLKWRKNKSHVSHITLPRAEELKDKGVKFAPYSGLLNEIRFDGRNFTLYLPTIEMYGRTDVVLRNLVRFEDSKKEIASQPLMSYVDLMECLIDKTEDVQVLRKSGTIQCHLDTNNAIANVWNGMRW